LSEEVVGLFAEKGWNLYNPWNERGDSINFAIAVAEGPASELSLGRRYKLVPAVDFPKNSNDVAREIKRIKSEKMLPMFGGRDGYWADTVMLTQDGLEAKARNRAFPFKIDYSSLAKGIRAGLTHYVPQTAAE
jgi:hypothetical protein